MTMLSVTLIKHTADQGAPVGFTYEWTYTTSARPHAVYRALAALRRDLPAEDSKRWKVMT